MGSLRLVPLLCSAGVVLGANGLLLTLVSLRARQEGFSDVEIGLIGTAYFVGFLFAGLYAPRMIQSVGHIRVFAGLAAIAAIAALVMILSVNPWTWIVTRVIVGFAVTGISTVNESWLNEAASKQNRGRILSLYRVVDLGAVTGAQFLIPFIGSQSFEIFILAGVFFCFGLLPVSLSSGRSPQPPAQAKVNLKSMYIVSPVAFVGVVTVGMTTGAFRTMAPVFAKDIGLDADGIALFMSLALIAGALSQFPLGWASDKFDRRWTLIVATGGAAVASFLLSIGGQDLIFIGVFLFGAFAMPLYSLSAAHANDHVDPARYVELSATLAITYTIGGALGPSVSSWVMASFGAEAFFFYTCILHGAFVAFVLYRMTKRAAVPAERRKGFVALLRNSAFSGRLAEEELEKGEEKS